MDDTTTAHEAPGNTHQVTMPTPCSIVGQSSCNHTSSEHTASKDISSGHISTVDTSTDHTTRGRTTLDHTPPDTATPDTATPDTATPDTATPDCSIPHTSTPIDIFPLPQELRDIIYVYLLDAEQVVAPCSRDIRVARAAVTNQPVEEHSHDVRLAHTYEFHTNILAVNKTINKEAKKVFRKNNFIVVDACWPDFTTKLLELDVPTVCLGLEKCIEPFAYAPLALTFTHPDSAPGPSTDGLVIVARDFPIFRRAMRWIFKQHHTTYELTVTNDGTTPEETFTIGLAGGAPQKVKTDIRILKQGFISKNASTIIPEIKSMSNPGQDVKVYFGKSDQFHPAASDSMEAPMSRKTFEAMIFFADYLQGTLFVKKAADEAARKGIWGQHLALARYNDIIRAWRTWDFFHDCMSNPLLMGAVKLPLFMLLQLLSDIASSASELHMRLHGLQGLDSLFNALLVSTTSAQDVLDCPHGGNISLAFEPGSHLLLMSPLIEDATPRTIETAKSSIEPFRQILDQKGMDSRRIAHDIAELDRILQDEDLLEKCVEGDPMSWQGLSCYHFPPRVFHAKVFEEHGHLFEEPK